jgi:hypothetical protein
MTEPTRPLLDAPAEATDSAPAAVNITRLVAEAMSKSGILWIRLPGGDTHPAWFVWHDDGDERGTGPAAYVISGIGEQPLPGCRPRSTSSSKDSEAACSPSAPPCVRSPHRRRVGRRGCRPAPGTAQPRRHHGGRRHALAAGLHDPRPHPHGRPTEQPGAYAAEPGSRRIAPAKAATARWRPWHWRGRPQSRRGTR